MNEKAIVKADCNGISRRKDHMTLRELSLKMCLVKLNKLKSSLNMNRP